MLISAKKQVLGFQHKQYLFQDICRFQINVIKKVHITWLCKTDSKIEHPPKKLVRKLIYNNIFYQYL